MAARHPISISFLTFYVSSKSIISEGKAIQKTRRYQKKIRDAQKLFTLQLRPVKKSSVAQIFGEKKITKIKQHQRNICGQGLCSETKPSKHWWNSHSGTDMKKAKVMKTIKFLSNSP